MCEESLMGIQIQKRESLLRSEFNYLAFATGEGFANHREEEGRVRVALTERGAKLLAKWRAASREERASATAELDERAREWRMQQAGVKLPSRDLILPPGVKR